MKNPVLTLCALIILYIIGAFYLGFSGMMSHAIDEQPRYLMLRNPYLFERHETLPFEIIRPMCWDAQLGFCDVGMDSPASRVAYLIDFETRLYGLVMQNEVGCWLWIFYPDYGDDGQPHIFQADWVECQ